MKLPPNTRRLIMMTLLLLSQQAVAAPDLTLNNPFQTWSPDRGDINVSFLLRREVNTLSVRVLDAEGKVRYNEQLFNLNPGPNHWQWSGKQPDGKLLTKGLYQIELTAIFPDGTQEQERLQLRIIAAPEITTEPASGFAPPAIKPYEPGYRLNGNLNYYYRKDNESDDVSHETRLNIRYFDQGEQYRLDANFGFLNRDPGIQNTDSTYAQYSRFWDQGQADLVFRRSLGNFEGPLRLFADFRTQNNKLGGKVSHQFESGTLTALAFDGQGGVGKETGGAARWHGKINPQWEYGFSATRRKTYDRIVGDTQNDAYSVDLRWKINNTNSLRAAHVRSHADSDVPGNNTSTVVEGKGSGNRLTWENTSLPGLRVNLGYLDLSRNYNAVLSDPGNQVTGNVKGPEGTFEYFRPNVTGSITDLALSLRAFSYDRYSHDPSITQQEINAQFMVRKAVRVSGNYRRRSDNGLTTTTMRLAEQHQWNARWRGGVQYSKTTSDGSRTQRVLIDGSTGSSTRYHRLGLELVRRDGRSITNGPVEEVGLLASGRYQRFLYEALARNTRDDNIDDVNVFAKLTYQQQYLHRYVSSFYVALGDRSTTETADRIEVGAGLSF